MLLTKKYFNNYQLFAVGSCIVMAILVGSIQTGFIIRSIKRYSKR